MKMNIAIDKNFIIFLYQSVHMFYWKLHPTCCEEIYFELVNVAVLTGDYGIMTIVLAAHVLKLVIPWITNIYPLQKKDFHCNLMIDFAAFIINAWYLLNCHFYFNP